jgi:hypothetical protein
MVWDGMYKRASDAGKESPDVLLARIDENIKFLKSGAEVVRIQLNTHEINDEKKFDDINKSIWRASGIVTGAVAVIVFLVNIFIKH